MAHNSGLLKLAVSLLVLYYVRASIQGSKVTVKCKCQVSEAQFCSINLFCLELMSGNKTLNGGCMHQETNGVGCMHVWMEMTL